MHDSVVSEVRKHREEILSGYGSLRNYHKAIIEQQKKYADRLISLPPKKKDSGNQKVGTVC